MRKAISSAYSIKAYNEVARVIVERYRHLNRNNRVRHDILFLECSKVFGDIVEVFNAYEELTFKKFIVDEYLMEVDIYGENTELIKKIEKHIQDRVQDKKNRVIPVLE